MPAAQRNPTTRYRTVDGARSICPGCRTELPAHATFCVECGLCMLDVTAEGTVIAATSEPGRPGGEIDDATSHAIELTEDDLELDIDALVAGLLGSDANVDLDLDSKRTRRFRPVSNESRERTTAPASDAADEIEIDISDDELELFLGEVSLPGGRARGPITPVSQWPAPPPGETVVAPVPRP